MLAVSHSLDTVRLAPNFKMDLRTGRPDRFSERVVDWEHTTWKDLGRPYRVENYSRQRRAWEREHREEMPVTVQWQHFNRRFHQLFVSDAQDRRSTARSLLSSLVGLSPLAALETLEDLIQLNLWNYVHRVQDAVWDPRGKRALFEGLDVDRPDILFLGAADGYEAMQLQAMYPGGRAVLVDYDDFCRTDRFGKFPEAYPFLGRDRASGHWRVYRKEEMRLEFVVQDIRELTFGAEFDIVLSVGLVEHFPDSHKGLVFDFHRRFLKPGGYAVITTPRREIRSKLFYLLMGELMNYGYRELMDERQLGLYAYENGFDILRCGAIKAHNGIVAKAR